MVVILGSLEGSRRFRATVHAASFAHKTIHNQIAQRSLLRADHVSQPCRSQHQRRLPIREGSHDPRFSSHFAQDTLHRVVRSQAPPASDIFGVVLDQVRSRRGVRRDACNLAWSTKSSWARGCSIIANRNSSRALNIAVSFSEYALLQSMCIVVSGKCSRAALTISSSHPGRNFSFTRRNPWFTASSITARSSR